MDYDINDTIIGTNIIITILIYLAIGNFKNVTLLSNKIKTKLK